MNTQNQNINREVGAHHSGCGCCGEYGGHKRGLWSPIILAALIGIGISFLLNLFSMGIGLSAFAADTTTGAKSLAIGGLIGLLIGTIIATGVMGWVAGYFGGLKLSHKSTNGEFCNYGSIYGFTAWSLALILTIILSAHLGNFVAGSNAALTNPSTRVENVMPNQNFVQTRGILTDDNRTATGAREDVAKGLAAASFISFVVFFIGALTATIAGHIAFARGSRKYNKYT